MSFENLNLHPLILKAIIDSGYTSPTPIQEQAIPELLAGHDIMASAQTGTGKTAAFMLPALHRLATPSAVHSRGPRVLVLTPTRELALQVSEAAAKYGKHLSRVKVVSILGGMPYPLQNKLLSQSVDILVATPGRLIDHIQRGRIDFSRLEMLVLDEADRMLDMGFIDDVERIASATPATRQTLLFSATLDSAINNVAARLLKSPKRIQIATQQAKLDNIEQRLHYVDDISHKNRLLDHLLRDMALKQAIVFTATKRDADTLADNLSAQGHEAAALHGDMNQRDRTRTLTKLRGGGLRVLVATDVAARGIDVAGITHVINFDLPKFAEDYVHRIGRTGRAGASGIAVSFASGKDGINLKKIERFTGQRIASHEVPGLEPRFKPRVGAGGASRSAPSVAHKRSRTWSNDNPRHTSSANSANGNWDDSRNRSPSAGRGDTWGNTRGGARGNSGGNTRSNSFGNSSTASPYSRTK
ncbi:DEAD/DEAH box helicase [Nitrosovibrio sp. Nv4]|uniref:DEAD/DEAH box helicase n=1 Tax=Nitrosovibrio sp. Nv4 TaxID=1945880 RepID=UPI000BCF3F58|nr:DEAD/DEAH box helicase [Nitrosovibrio sp. Nv4]SOD42093.1 Superfamily II DNA and RNA helicase [Nitrosovibrio sp. Nv4]